MKKNILEKIKMKIEKLNSDYSKQEISLNEYLIGIEKFNQLNNLISDKYNNFFLSINMDIACSILKDIGVADNELLETYNSIISEEMENQYYLYETSNKL